MNNCRAGLYSFAPTTTWLHKTGMASPPSLVMLGLTLPNSRILSGIASIGLTLANIAIILPYLRRSVLDSVHAHEATLTGEHCTMEHEESLTNGFNATHPVDLGVKSPLHTDFKATPHTTPLLSASATDDGLTPPQILETDFREHLVSSNHPLMREGRSALHIPLPVPDEAEVVFFAVTDASLFNIDPQEKCPETACERYTIPERLAADENVPPVATRVIVPDLHDPVVEGTISQLTVDFTPCDDTAVSGQTEPSLIRGKEDFANRRPESLEFIPQSVIRRYPSAPLASARPCFGNRALGYGDVHQLTPAPRHILVQNPEALPEGVRPRAGYATLEGHWRVPFLTSDTDVYRTGQAIGTFITETVPTQDTLEYGTASLQEPPTVYELTPVRRYPIHRRRLGVLARAVLRHRRSTVHRYRNVDIDGSSTSDSDSELDSESQHSSESSTDEGMLPHILGADLIAAIDANSESELNLVGSRKTVPAPLDVYDDFLLSEDSTADVSMVMHVSLNDGACDSEVSAPATSRALTYEEIQQWATGVVQKCVRQVYRSRAPMEPLSPSQASDVCAERPSGSRVSQCPLSGLHCKLGGGASASRVKESLGSLPPTAIRNIRDIPEFVPRQRHGSAVTGCAEVPDARKLGMRSAIDVTREAATEVIARMESQAGFKVRERLVSTPKRV